MISKFGAKISEFPLVESMGVESMGLARLLLLSMLKMWPSGKCVINECSKSSVTLTWNFESVLVLAGLQLIAWPKEPQ